jgi:hypothetical protein
MMHGEWIVKGQIIKPKPMESKYKKLIKQMVVDCVIQVN